VNVADGPISGKVQHIRLEFRVRREKRFSCLMVESYLDRSFFSVAVDKFQNAFQLSTPDDSTLYSKDCAQFFDVTWHCVGNLNCILPFELMLL